MTDKSLTYADLKLLMDSLPRMPRLVASEFVPRGVGYQLAACPEVTGDTSPLVVMHPDDIEECGLSAYVWRRRRE